MVYEKDLGIKQRITQLKKLITDAKEMGFNSFLILGYSNQLEMLNDVVVRDEAKRKAHIKSNQ